jgi:tetratricopeptide (TPR) repeat protein
VRKTFQVVALLVALILPVAADQAGGQTQASRYDEALAAYRDTRLDDALALLSPPPGLEPGEFNLLGWVHLRAGNAHDAIAAFTRSLGLDPSMLDSSCGLGFAYLRTGDADRALRAFELAAAGSPGRECLDGLERARAAAGRPLTTPAEQALDEERRPSRYVARGDYFWHREGDERFEPLYVKGVNLSFARPGKHITEFPRDAETYLEWFGLISEMHANVIRVYTILPPEFYAALREFNRGRASGERLRLIQGIWAVLPEAHRFSDPAYVESIEHEIAAAVDVVHGRATLAHRYGHAHGVYRADVSADVLAFIFGREWEPSAVRGFQQIDRSDSYRGDYLSIDGANPMEAWLTARLDRLIGYEQDTYKVQRPVAWMNWPTLDALHHPAEATFDESAAFRRALGEDVARPPEDEIYDDDAVTVDETKVVARPSFRAGLFASHHVYPYYPDFMRNEPGYVDSPDGPYRAYLKQLNAYYEDMPLLISEYGVPTSRAVGRFHPGGLDHGGHTEASQAEALRTMTADIHESGSAGGVVFAWIDEWVKRNWMVAGTEGQDRRWYNAMDPEESYGLMAMLPADRSKLRGDPAAWDDSTRLSEGLFADSDAGYVYLRLDVDGEIDWSEQAFVLAIDTVGDAEGDHTLPLELGVHSDVGVEFAVVLHGDRSRLLVDHGYGRTRYSGMLAGFPGRTGWEFRDDYRLVSNDDGRFEELKIPHGRKFGRDGTVYPESIYEAGRLIHGNRDEAGDWLYTADEGMIEIRLPWGLLNVSDPSRREVLVDSKERRITPGLRVAVYPYRPRSLADSNARAAAEPSEMATYTWETWDDPEYVSHLKSSYRQMQETFAGLAAPDSRWELPAQFDFISVIENHYATMDEFFALPAVRRVASADGDDLYGLAMANLAFALVSGNNFYLHEAHYLLHALRGDTEDPRVAEAAELGVAYLRGLLAGGVRAGTPGDDRGERIAIQKRKPRRNGIETITLGRSAIRLRDGANVRTQVDRVTRDWLSGMNFTSAPAHFDAKRVVPWHEGSRTLDLVNYADVRVEPVWGTRVRKVGERWLAPDADGTFRFEVTPDKVYGYPTNLFLDDRNVWINDTHGISSLAWDSAGADLVIGCGDHGGKADAAYDLAVRGVNVYMPTDRYLYTLIGTDTPGTVLGSAPIRDTPEGATLGGQEVTFRVDEPIVVSWTQGRYPVQYYDTPHSYFTALGDWAGVEFDLTSVEITEYGTVGIVVERARELGAQVLGIRVATIEEHDAVAAWLSEDPARRAILFHTAVYPDGYRLFAEFPDQTSFGDVRPVLGR